jgi:hypothetical protein
MKHHVAFLLSLLLGAGSAFAQSGETINQLSRGAALNGTEQIPMYQGSNPAVTTTPRAVATYIPTQFNTIDATQSSGSDMCAKISAAATAQYNVSPGGGIIDARGFSGSQTCAGNMFANWPGNGFWSVVLLGDVQITTGAAQVIPTRTTLRGVSPYNDTVSSGQAGGASIKASGTFPTGTALISLGSSNPAFAIHLDHIAVDCSAISGSIGVQNLYSQEQTVVDHIVIRGCYTGLQVSLDAGDTHSYTFLTMTDTGLSGSNFLCFQVGRPTDTGTSNNNFVGEIAYVSCGGYVTTPTNYILLDGQQFAVRHIYIEGNSATNGINIGSQTAGGLRTRNVIVEDATVAAVNGVTLSSGVNGPITLRAIAGGSTNLLNDTLGGGCVIPYSQETALGFYARGYAGRIVDDSSYCPKP